MTNFKLAFDGREYVLDEADAGYVRMLLSRQRFGDIFGDRPSLEGLHIPSSRFDEVTIEPLEEH